MGLKENLEAAEAAVKYVKGLGIRANNKVWDRLAAEGGVDFMKNGTGFKIGGKTLAPTAIMAVKNTREDAADAVADAQDDMALPLLFGAATAEDAQLATYRARWGVTLGSKAGNCEEQAIGALLYLFDNYGQVRPLHLMTFSEKGYDHVWVGVGLKDTWNKLDTKKKHNLREWGPDAVWCDPWQGDGVAFAVADFIKGKVRNLNASFKCNTPELVEAGVPISKAKFD
jgi:hypothetical protein